MYACARLLCHDAAYGVGSGEECRDKLFAGLVRNSSASHWLRADYRRSEKKRSSRDRIGSRRVHAYAVRRVFEPD